MVRYADRLLSGQRRYTVFLGLLSAEFRPRVVTESRTLMQLCCAQMQHSKVGVHVDSLKSLIFKLLDKIFQECQSFRQAKVK